MTIVYLQFLYLVIVLFHLVQQRTQNQQMCLNPKLYYLKEFQPIQRSEYQHLT